MVTFLVAGYRCRMTGTKSIEIILLVTEARECEQLAQGSYLAA